MGFMNLDRDLDPLSGVHRIRSRQSAARGSVLVVDDDASACRALDELLRMEGFVTSTASGGEAALAEARRALPDVVLTDLQMPGIGGMALCQKLHEMDPDLPVIVMTARTDMESVIQSLRAGAEDYLIKPLQHEAVLWCVERARARRAEKLERAELYRQLNERLVLSSIREREHAEVEARHHAQLNALVANLKEGVVIADKSGRLLMINDAARAILGVADEELHTVDAFHSWVPLELEVAHHDDERPLARALRGEHFMDYEVSLLRPNGERRRVVSTGTSVRDENDGVELAIVVFRDVTELRRLERQREEYVSLVSHDLRSPLSAVLTCLFMLKAPLEKKGLTEEGGFVARAARNVRRMAEMLDELTEATSLESQNVALERVPCDLRELVATGVDSVDDSVARRITIETDGTPHYVVLAEAPRIERVIVNLLTNALKYSPPDAPVIARLTRKEGAVELDVVDRGIGIAPSDVRNLFDRNFRTTAGKARATGLGLGLYIARLIVEAHGGRIDVFSEVGKGSTFRLTLPSYDQPGDASTPSSAVTNSSTFTGFVK